MMMKASKKMWIWKKKYRKSDFSEFIDMEATNKKPFILVGTTQKEGNEDI